MLSKAMPTGVRDIDSSMPEFADVAPKPVPCEYCGALRYTKGFTLCSQPRWTYLMPCTCAEATAARERAKREAEAAKEREEAEKALKERRARIEKLIGQSGLGRRFTSRTFDTFEATSDETARALKFAKGYAERFSDMKSDPKLRERNGLFITGEFGTGKTHLAAAIANALLSKGEPVVFATMIDLLQKLKDSFEKGGEGDLLRVYVAADLLIIDDLGKEQPTEWATTKIYQIINARYEDFKPTIITSNYSLDELVNRMTPKTGDGSTAGATIDRLREVTFTIPLGGLSKRKARR